MRFVAPLRFSVSLLSLALAGTLSLSAQSSVGTGQTTPVKDSSMLHPPVGQKIAIVEWEDLECPACAHAFPIVHEAASHYHIPVVRYDFLIPVHLWSRDASIYARYLQDKVSPDLAMEYRREVFASQFRINSKEDLHRFTEKFFADHHQQLPFVVDPTGQLLHEVEADDQLGQRMGLQHTPTIFVVTPHHYIDVTDVSNLYQAIDQAEAAEGGKTTTASATAHKVTAHK